MEYNNNNLFGSQIRILSKEKHVTYIDYGTEEGKALVTVCDVIPGVKVVLNDFYTDTAFRKVDKQEVIEINHCKRGRFECELSGQRMLYMGEGDLALSGMENLPVTSSFPIKLFYGISILIFPDMLRKNPLFREFSIDFDRIYEKYQLKHNCHVLHRNHRIECIFSEIYNAFPNINLDFLKLKIVELSYHLQESEWNGGEQELYFNKRLANKVKHIRDHMIECADRRITLEALVKEHNMSLTQFKACFRRIYGDSPYSYLRTYRMNLASRMLLEEDLKVNEVALELSYQNPSKFSKAFQSVMGVSPKEYRLMNKII